MFWRTLGLSAALLVAATVGVGSVQATSVPRPKVIARGLNVPTGVLAMPDGTVIVAESGTAEGVAADSRNFETGEEHTTAFIGQSSRVLRVDERGKQTLLTTLPSLKIGQATYGAHHLVQLGEAVYVATTAWADYVKADRPEYAASVVRIAPDGVSMVGDMYEFEREYNPNGLQRESDPYGIAADAAGMIWVSDSGGNTLLRLDPDSGEIVLVAVFGGMFSPIPNPNRNGQNVADPVPSGLEVGADGNLYVALFSGMPFLPGTSKVVRVTPQGAITDYATDQTTIIDVALGPDGQLYGLSYGEFTGQGLGAERGRVLRLREGRVSEIVIDNLNSPTAMDFDAKGNLYVTVDSAGGEGSGKVVRYDNLITYPSIGQTTPLQRSDVVAPTPWVGETAASPVAANAAARLPIVWALVVGGALVLFVFVGAIVRGRRTPGR